MAEETITILKVETGEAVISVGDLKENIKVLKKNLDDLEIGTQEYQETLSELKVNQNALKDAMYATSGSMEDLAAAANGTSMTYNSLVHQMASLKEELRATDVSTESGKKKFEELAAQVNNVNDQLKAMDALQGNYQRNVGNYVQGFSKIGDTLKAMPPTLGATKEKLGKLGETMNLVGKQPILGIIGLLAPMIMKITASLKENETATQSVKKAMASLQPVFDLLDKALEAIANTISKVVDWFVGLAGESGDTFKNIIAGAIGVGNVLLQYMLTPIKTLINAFKGLGNIVKDVFTGEFAKIKDDAVAAWDGIKDAFANGFSFKNNFEEGKRIGEQFVQGLGSSKGKAKEAGEELGASAADGFTLELEKDIKDFDKILNQEMADAAKAVENANKDFEAALSDRLSIIDKAEKRQLESNDILTEDEREKANRRYEIQADANQRRLDALKQFQADALAAGNLEEYLALDQQVADLEIEIENNKLREKKRLRQQDTADAIFQAKEQMRVMRSVAGATSSVLSSIADMYESDEENAEKNAGKMKALRIASATIDTIAGAIGAFMMAAETLPPPYGAIVGGIEAAAITAAGLAQINQIRSTNVGSSSGGGSSSVGTMAPVSQPNITEVRNITTASDEEKIGQSQKVYLVTSELEAQQNSRKVQLAESSF